MGTVVRFFVSAKHWQIFLLLFGIGYVGGSAAMLLPLITARSPQEFLKISLSFMFVMALFMLCFLAWLWSMGSFLNSIGKPTSRLRLGFFRFALLYPAAYIFVFFALFNTTKSALPALIFPLHLFAMYCLFYALYFVSKSLALAESAKPVYFYDYAGTLLLLWFFLIGVWFIQPRINRFASRREDITSQDTPDPLTAPSVRTVDNETEVAPRPTPLAYAGLWLRLAAALIDGFLMFFPMFFLSFVSVVVVRLVSKGSRHDPSIGILVALVAVVFLVPWFYFSLSESSRWQATVGKNVLRLYVTDIEGHRATRGRAMSRNLAKYLSNLTMGIGHLMCGFTIKKQALHDMLAGCLVLRRPR